MLQKSGLISIPAAAILFSGYVFAQGGPNRAIYFLKDDTHGQWCGYANESRMKAQVQPLQPSIVGKVQYTDRRVSAVRVTETDETGDWAVNDEYAFDGSGKLRALKRTIDILPEDASQEQLFVIMNGKVNLQRTVRHELRSGKPTQKHVDWFEPPPIITSLQNFPFSALIAGKRRTVWSTGEVCIPDTPK